MKVLDDICRSLHDLHQEGYFQQVQQIPTASDVEEYDYAATEFSKTLTHLLLYDQFEYSVGEEHTLQMCAKDSLPIFSNLQHLEVRHHTNYNIFKYDEFFHPSTKLKFIKYTAFHTDINRALDQEFGYDVYERDEYDAIDMNMEMEDPREEKATLSQIKPSADVKEFKGSFIFYNDSSVDYFMHKFPQLNVLEINSNCNKQLIHDIYFNGLPLSTNSMIKFFKFIIKIPIFNYGNIMMINNDGERINTTTAFITKVFKTQPYTSATLQLVYQDVNYGYCDETKPLIGINNNNKA